MKMPSFVFSFIEEPRAQEGFVFHRFTASAGLLGLASARMAVRRGRLDGTSTSGLALARETTGGPNRWMIVARATKLVASVGGSGTPRSALAM
jgi:hypothetical protein